MPQVSAGLLLHRKAGNGHVILLGHMGGPFWARKDAHAWSIPKGLRDDSEADLLAVAEREFEEEMGSPAPAGDSVSLGSVRSGAKTIHAFARAGNFNAETAVSNTFEIEWPRGSGQLQTFPEIDRAEWLTIDEARIRLVKGQQPFLDRLVDLLS